MKASGEFFLGDVGVDSGGSDDDTKGSAPASQLLIYVDDLHVSPKGPEPLGTGPCLYAAASATNVIETIEPAAQGLKDRGAVRRFERFST